MKYKNFNDDTVNKGYLRDNLTQEEQYNCHYNGTSILVKIVSGSSRSHVIELSPQKQGWCNRYTGKPRGNVYQNVLTLWDFTQRLIDHSTLEKQVDSLLNNQCAYKAGKTLGLAGRSLTIHLIESQSLLQFISSADDLTVASVFGKKMIRNQKVWGKSA